MTKHSKNKQTTTDKSSKFTKQTKPKKKYHKKIVKAKEKPQLPLQEKLAYKGHTVTLTRYPATEDRALRAWSNAELLALQYLDKQIDEQNLMSTEQIYTYNDRFGVWSCLLNANKTTPIITHASQKKAIEQNLNKNGYSAELLKNMPTHTPLDKLNKVDLALIKVPKSVELFELFLQQIHQASTENTQVICCFMTKFFANSVLKIAEKYFEEVEQSQAWKKARLLILKKPRYGVEYPTLINSIDYHDKEYRQYYGVFSAEKIDIGTQFLLEQYDNGNLMVKAKELKILDLACGNGIIAGELSRRMTADSLPQATFTLLDDFALAVESAKLNMQGLTAEYICDDGLQRLPDAEFDLVVSNPPFHFEHESNIEVAMSLFAQVSRVLKAGGRFVLVANKHLNYETHLTGHFKKVFVVATNKKFEVYECVL